MAYQTKFDGNTDKTVKLGTEGNPKSIEGYFLGTRTTPDNGYGPGKLHIFQTSDGTIGVWGKTRLNNLLTSELVGQMTLVTFTGMIAPAKKGRKPSYGFKVQHDKDNTIDTSGINLSAADPQEPEEDELSEPHDSNEDEEYQTPSLKSSSPLLKSPDAEKRAKVQALLNGKR